MQYKIILYSTNCPKCRMLAKRLDIKGIDYEINNDIELMIKKGFSEAPMLEILTDGLITTMDFNTAVDWLELQTSKDTIKDNGGECDCCSL